MSEQPCLGHGQDLARVQRQYPGILAGGRLGDRVVRRQRDIRPPLARYRVAALEAEVSQGLRIEDDGPVVEVDEMKRRRRHGVQLKHRISLKLRP